MISPSHQAARLLSRAIIHRLRGEVAEAERDVDEALRISSDQEPQVAALLPQNLGLRRWPHDPAAAAAGLATWATDHRDSLGPRNLAVQELAGMALRLDDCALLRQAVELHRSTREGYPSPLHAARDAWVDGLAADDLAAVETADGVRGTGVPRHRRRRVGRRGSAGSPAGGGLGFGGSCGRALPRDEHAPAARITARESLSTDPRDPGRRGAPLSERLRMPEWCPSGIMDPCLPRDSCQRDRQGREPARSG